MSESELANDLTLRARDPTDAIAPRLSAAARNSPAPFLHGRVVSRPSRVPPSRADRRNHGPGSLPPLFVLLRSNGFARRVFASVIGSRRGRGKEDAQNARIPADNVLPEADSTMVVNRSDPLR